MNDKENSRGASTGLSRRSILLGAAATPFGVAAAEAATPSETAAAKDIINLDQSYPFYGVAGQAGVETPPQRHVTFMTFDLTASKKEELQILLARWSAAIAQMMKGEPVGLVDPERPNAVAFDTGEALNLGAASLTVTVGLGPDVFGPQFGLSGMKPPLMRTLKALPGDNLKAELSGGDLSVQACADDPQVAYHAVRLLARIGKSTGFAATRWSVMGFGRASAGKHQQTPRNLLGFKDGTRNIVEKDQFEKFVWIKDGPDWQRNGTYQVVRKVKMFIESWDTDRVNDQNDVFGRFKVSGAPLSGTHEFDIPDFEMKRADGSYVIPRTAHISLAAHEHNDGLRILRRSYNYTDGINDAGMLDAGLLFISYQNDPAAFEKLQTKLGAADALNEYISHIGSAVFYVPPAPQEGGYIGQEFFA